MIAGSTRQDDVYRIDHCHPTGGCRCDSECDACGRKYRRESGDLSICGDCHEGSRT